MYINSCELLPLVRSGLQTGLTTYVSCDPLNELVSQQSGTDYNSWDRKLVNRRRFALFRLLDGFWCHVTGCEPMSLVSTSS